MKQSDTNALSALRGSDDLIVESVPLSTLSPYPGNARRGNVRGI